MKLQVTIELGNDAFGDLWETHSAELLHRLAYYLTEHAGFARMPFRLYDFNGNEAGAAELLGVPAEGQAR